MSVHFLLHGSPEQKGEVGTAGGPHAGSGVDSAGEISAHHL